jgi:cytochrome c oxidase subunit 1
MPRRYYSYPPEFQALHVISTVGSWVLASGMIFTLVYLARAAVSGPRADNPWRSASYEWMTRSPPPKHNFDVSPVFDSDPYDYTRPR